MVTVPIAMTSIRGLGPLPDYIAQQYGEYEVHLVFKRAGIADDITQRTPLRMLLLKDLVELFHHAAIVTGDDLVGVRVGQAMVDDFGAWTHYVRAAPTLRECLTRFERCFPYHQSGGALHLTESGSIAKLHYRVGLSAPDWQAQHFEHALPAVLATFRTYLGASWEPKYIEADYGVGQRLSDLESYLKAPIAGSSFDRSVVFERASLDAHRIKPMREEHLPRHEIRDFVSGRPPVSLPDVMLEVLQARLSAAPADLASIAADLGFAPRSLQRQLGLYGTSFRKVTDTARLRLAEHLLCQQDLSITDIAFRLGFSDPAHFARNFRQLKKLTPSAYRQYALNCGQGIVNLTECGI